MANPGANLSITQIAKLALDQGYDVLADTYKPKDLFWAKVCTVRPVTEAIHYPFGHRSVGAGRIGKPQKRSPGQPFSADTVEAGYVRQCMLQEYVTSLPIPIEILDAVGGRAEFDRKVVDFAAGFGAVAGEWREDIVATFIQRGTIAAGDPAVFKQEYGDFPDANVGFIYDGKPLYAASGNAHPLKSVANTGSQGVNLVASGADLDGATLDTGYIQVTQTNAVDERGNRITVMPKYLMGGSAMRTTILRLLNSESLPGTGNNDINPNRGLLEPLIWPLLDDDTNAWWIHGAESLTAFDGANVLDTVYDESTKTLHLRGSIRFGIYCPDWRYTYCANKASS